jgi:hypothetical protein
VQKAMDASSALIELFKYSKMNDVREKFDYADQLKEADKCKDALLADGDDPCAAKLADCLNKAGYSVLVQFVQDFAEANGGKLSTDALFGAVWTTLGWAALRTKKISITTLARLPWYSRIYSTIVGASAPASRHTEDSIAGVKLEELIPNYSFTKTAFVTLLGRQPSESELYEFQVLLGLIITNGPGTISAQGAKGAVSADGPEQPQRIQVNKAFIGFLTHTGFAHGGNGYEAAAFLLENFKGKGLKSAADTGHGLDLDAMAMEVANKYSDYKKKQKAIGNLDYAKLPCVNHPVFKGKDVNYDPREVFVRELFKEKDINNVFLDFYHSLVQSLFKSKVSKNVYCVNIDAVIAVILLKVVWSDFQDGKMKEEDVESASFATFLFGRMIGCAAEIDDHTSRGKNMDTRTPASKVRYVG